MIFYECEFFIVILVYKTKEKNNEKSIYIDFNDISDIEKVINNHWDDWNASKYKGYVLQCISSGTMNGDSNGFLV